MSEVFTIETLQSLGLICEGVTVYLIGKRLSRMRKWMMYLSAEIGEIQKQMVSSPRPGTNCRNVKKNGDQCPNAGACSIQNPGKLSAVRASSKPGAETQSISAKDCPGAMVSRTTAYSDDGSSYS